jgi:hypothetical protein
MNSRERVVACLLLKTPDRPPRHIWTVPWSVKHHGTELEEIRRRFPEDIWPTTRALFLKP